MPIFLSLVLRTQSRHIDHTTASNRSVNNTVVNNTVVNNTSVNNTDADKAE